MDQWMNQSVNTTPLDSKSASVSGETHLVLMFRSTAGLRKYLRPLYVKVETVEIFLQPHFKRQNLDIMSFQGWLGPRRLWRRERDAVSLGDTGLTIKLQSTTWSGYESPTGLAVSHFKLWRLTGSDLCCLDDHQNLRRTVPYHNHQSNQTHNLSPQNRYEQTSL